MLKEIDFIFRTMLAELAQRLAETPASKFDTDGRFVPVTVKSRRYWYFDSRGAWGAKIRKYVGPDDDETIRHLVAEFRELKDNATARRKIVRMLTREASLPAPDPTAGKIIKSLAEAGLFRRDCILIERHAYQCFAAYLGVGLPGVPWKSTQPGISLSIRASADIVTVRDILSTSDRTFTPEAPVDRRKGDVRFVNSEGYCIELAIPTLLGAYLVEDPVRTVMLHKTGIEVTIPRPERFALHELLMSGRTGTEDDMRLREHSGVRALATMQALLHVRRQADLAEAYEAAWNRSKAWRTLIERAITLIDDVHWRARILEGLTQGMKDIGSDAGYIQKI